jgi:ribose-phosphate pyrophosphokinase
MLQLYGLDPAPVLARAVANCLGQLLCAHEDRAFEDGEHKLRPLVDPRGGDCYVLDSLHGDPFDSPHDKLCRMLMFIATLRAHGAARVSAVVPYLAYARKDRQTKPFDPVGLQHVARLFEAVGTAQLVVLEAHNVAAFQNAFRIPTLHIEAHRAFGPALALPAGHAPLVVASPDPGGVKRAQLWREALAEHLARPVGFALIDKRRSGGLLGSEGLVAGDVANATVLLLDDLIASGQTMAQAAQALRQLGARRVLCFAGHGLFTADAASTLASDTIDAVVVTDSVPTFRLSADAAVRSKLQVLSVAGLLAQAIADSHGSVVP